MSYFYIVLAVAFNVGFTGLLKVSAKSGLGQFSRYSWLVVALWFGAINAFFFSRALEKLDLSKAYPIYSGGSIVVTLGLGLMFFREKLTLSSAFGTAAIIVGIYLVKR